MSNATGIFNSESKSFRKANEHSTKYSGADIVQYNGSTGHFFIICAPDMPAKWRASGGQIPLIDVVEKFAVFKGSMRGESDHPSSGELL